MTQNDLELMLNQMQIDLAINQICLRILLRGIAQAPQTPAGFLEKMKKEVEAAFLATFAPLEADQQGVAQKRALAKARMDLFFGNLEQSIGVPVGRA